MSESTLERKIRIVTPKPIPEASVFASWEPTPPHDGDFGLKWNRPRPDDVFAGLPIPVTITAERAVTGHDPVLELLDNDHKVVVTSLWFKPWSRSNPQLRTTVKAPGDLDAARNTHKFRLSMIAPEIAGRSATSYRSFQAAGAGAQPTIMAAGAGPKRAAKSFSTRSAKSVHHAQPDSRLRVNLNKASAAEIAEHLPGIGPSLAQ